MPDVPESSKVLHMSVGLFWTVLSGAVITTFMLTMIWNRFLRVEGEYTEHISDLRERIEYVDGRIDRKHDQQQEDLVAIWAQIEELRSTVP